MEYKRFQTDGYKQLKLRKDLHQRIKTLASQNNLTINDFLDKLTYEMVQPQKQQMP